jgi:hypothetical protein
LNYSVNLNFARKKWVDNTFIFESKMIKSAPYSVYDDEGIKEKKEKAF